MKNPPVEPKDKQPTCLAELDFQILCQTEGKEKAIAMMLVADALTKEDSAKDVSN